MNNFTVMLICLFFAISCSSNHPSVIKKQKSKNFKDGRFFNTTPFKEKSLFEVFKMRFNSNWSDWPEWVETNTSNDISERIKGSKIKVTFINHATMLIQTENINIITDPIFSKRASPVSFAGPKRVHAPGIELSKLPPIDYVLISHDHYDHLDLDTISKLIKKDNPKILTGLGVGQRLDSLENVYELDWWESQSFENIKFSFVRVQHFSGRGLGDWFTTLWGGYVIEVNGKKIYFGGDSGYADHYKKTFEKFGAMDLAFLPIGAYEPRWFMKDAHMNPKEAVQAHFDLKSKKSIGIHFGTFQLTAESRDTPEKELESEKKKVNLKDEFVTLKVGESTIESF